MEFSTVLLIFLAFVAALGLSWFQYFYKSKSRLKINKLLFILRFLALFGVLLLLINPKITQTLHEIVKTPLVIAVDNSRSIRQMNLNEVALTVKEKLQSDSELKEKFDIQVFGRSEERRVGKECRYRR